MVKIIEPKIETAELKSDGTYGRFVVEPLDRGSGITLGNSLRRVLLSSLPGVAVTSIKIDGVQHEFSTIEGVKEDVTEIVLNIKGLTAKLYCDGPKIVYINAEGEGEVPAGSIQCDADVEILDPSMHIATLGPNAVLRMEIVLDKGQGYVSSEKNKQIARDKSSDKSIQEISPLTNTPRRASSSAAAHRLRCLPVSAGPVTRTALRALSPSWPITYGRMSAKPRI